MRRRARSGRQSGYSSASRVPPRLAAGQAPTSMSRNGAACGGPAANSQTGGSFAGSASSAEHTVPKPPRGATFNCSAGQQVLPDLPARGRVGRRRGGEVRQVARHAGTVQVVRVVRGDHVQAGGKAPGLRTPLPQASHENRAGRIGEDKVEAAPLAGIESADRLGGGLGGGMVQREQWQFTSAALSRGGSQAALAVQHRRRYAVAV